MSLSVRLLAPTDSIYKTLPHFSNNDNTEKINMNFVNNNGPFFKNGFRKLILSILYTQQQYSVDDKTI